MVHLMTFCQFLSQGRTELSKLKNDYNSFSSVLHVWFWWIAYCTLSQRC